MKWIITAVLCAVAFFVVGDRLDLGVKLALIAVVFLGVMRILSSGFLIGAAIFAVAFFAPGERLQMEVKLALIAVLFFVLSQALRLLKSRFAGPQAQKLYDDVKEWFETGWSAILLAAVLMYFLVQAFKIPSGSMRMTLLEGDHLFVNKFVYGFHIPFADGKRLWQKRVVKRGDIIIFKCPPAALSPLEREQNITKDFIKRCVAIGGDTVLIRDKKLLVNGAVVNEPYTSFVDRAIYPAITIYQTSDQYQRAWESGKFDGLPASAIRDNFGPVIVPPGHYFCMGDNRDQSFDSRFWGPLPDKYLKGRALFLYFPLNRWKIIR